jgi:hypothetical protein
MDSDDVGYASSVRDRRGYPARSRTDSTGGRTMQKRKRITLRSEHTGADSRFLLAYLDDAGALHIDGHDLGPGTSPVSDDGEYEWFTTYAPEDVPKVVALLGGAPGDDVLDLLAARYTGAASYELEAKLRASGLPVKRHVY